MTPITLLAVRKVFQTLTANDALEQAVESANRELGLRIPALQSSSIVLSSASTELGDRNVQLRYPRLLLASEGIKNTREEKFMSFSGSVSISATVLASGNLVNEAEDSLHYYVEALTSLLRRNLGDMGDNVFFGGTYEVQFQPSKVGGLGFVQGAKVTFELLVSRN